MTENSAGSVPAPVMSDIETKLREALDVEQHLRDRAADLPEKSPAAINYREAADTIAALRKQVSDAVGAFRLMEPHVRTVRGAVRINDEWGRVVQGQTLAAIELAQAFDATLATLTGGKADARD